jgi:putative restriction endonuclease
MNPDILKQKFQNLTLWKRGGERAPHKPLLALYALGRVLRNEDRFIPYEEVDRKLTRLLQEFGPDRKSYNPHYPFWRLQKDDIWQVRNTEHLHLTSSGDPKKTELIQQNVTGGFPEPVFRELRQNPAIVREIVQDLLDTNFPETIHEDILQSVGIDMAPTTAPNRPRDPAFRERILRAYEYRCAICGFDVRIDHFPVALEAAHIKWHQAGGPDTEINGIALCSLHHKLFDRGAFTLSDNLEIMVSDRANGREGFQEWLLRFHGTRIHSPQRATYVPNSDFRIWHVREVFKGGFRDPAI